MFYFMLLMVLTLPILMIIFGFIFKKNPPKSINWFYGYRTFRSMKDQKSWDYANKKMGEYWFKIGWIILPLSVIPLLFVKNSNIDIVFQSKAMNIKIKGIALKEGSIGDTILVRSDKYNKTYTGIVKSENEVMVRI